MKIIYPTITIEFTKEEADVLTLLLESINIADFKENGITEQMDNEVFDPLYKILSEYPGEF